MTSYVSRFSDTVISRILCLLFKVMPRPKRTKKFKRASKDDNDEKGECVMCLDELIDRDVVTHLCELIVCKQTTDHLLAIGDSLFTSRSGWIQTKYYRAECGRLFAYPSLQTVKGWMLRILCHRYYRDFDFVNAAPVLFAHACFIYLDYCPPHLRLYAANRQSIIDSIRANHPELGHLDDKFFKELLLRVLHGGCYRAFFIERGITFVGDILCVESIRIEIKEAIVNLRIHPDLSYVYIQLNADKTVHNLNGRFVARVWQDLECKCLLEMVAFFSSRRVKTAVLKHDGCMVYGDKLNGVDINAFLTQASAHILDKTGITITIVEKSLIPSTQDWDLYYGPKNLGLLLNPLDKALHVLTQVAYQHRLRRSSTHVMSKHPTLPCVFVEGSLCNDWINQTLLFNHIELSNIKHVSEWFSLTDHPRFPLLGDDGYDRSKIAFVNGYFDMNTLGFHVWTDVHLLKWSTLHWFNIPYDCGIQYDTPLWNMLIDTQLALHNKKTNTIDRSLCLTFEMLVGRLFYPVGEYDNFQVCPMLIGDANTGKSSIIEIVQAMFPKSQVGCITSSMEEKFGLMAFMNKRVVFAPDLPWNIHKLLSAADFQSMVTGEVISFAIKGKPAVTKRWTSPMLWVGNKHPQWRDAAGSIVRRIAPFWCKTLVLNRDVTIKGKILTNELVAIMMRCIFAYRNYVSSNGIADFWVRAPLALQNAQSDIRVATSDLTDFLTNGSSYYQIVKKIGSQTTLAELGKAFSYFMEYDKKKRGVLMGTDLFPIKAAGFIVKSSTKCKICQLSCNKRNCGDHFHRQNKRNVHVIVDMEIIRKDNRQGDSGALRVSGFGPDSFQSNPAGFG